MSSYEVEFTRSAQKELRKLPAAVAFRIVKAVDKLSVNPRQGNVRPMVGTSSWRLRVGEYRVIYDIRDGRLRVLIVRVRHRREAYRK